MAVTLHTNYGDIKVEVFCDTTPIASENFLGLCASGSYDGTLFHRNIKQFMIQGGDPTGTGKGKSTVMEFNVSNDVIFLLVIYIYTHVCTQEVKAYGEESFEMNLMIFTGDILLLKRIN